MFEVGGEARARGGWAAAGAADEVTMQLFVWGILRSEGSLGVVGMKYC